MFYSILIVWRIAVCSELPECEFAARVYISAWEHLVEGSLGETLKLLVPSLRWVGRSIYYAIKLSLEFFRSSIPKHATAGCREWLNLDYLAKLHSPWSWKLNPPSRSRPRKLSVRPSATVNGRTRILFNRQHIRRSGGLFFWNVGLFCRQIFLTEKSVHDRVVFVVFSSLFLGHLEVLGHMICCDFCLQGAPSLCQTVSRSLALILVLLTLAAPHPVLPSSLGCHFHYSMFQYYDVESNCESC